jgi:hypothetical protein
MKKNQYLIHLLRKIINELSEIRYKIVSIESLGRHELTKTASENANAKQETNNADTVMRATEDLPNPVHIQNDTEKYENKWPKVLWKIFEGLGIGAVVAYSIITYYQWQDSHKDFVFTERAWLSFSGDFPEVPKAGAPAIGYLKIKNIGKTVAKDIHYVVIFKIQPREQQAKMEYAGTGIKGFAKGLIPDDTVSIPAMRPVEPFSAIPFSGPEVESLTSGNSLIVIYAKGTYDDVFGGRHWFHACQWHPYAGNLVFKVEDCAAYTESGDGELPADKTQ